MSESLILFGKAMTLALWVLVGLALCGLVPAPYHWMVLGFGTIVLVAHLMEITYLLTKHRERIRGATDLISVLVYGVFTLQPLIAGDG